MTQRHPLVHAVSAGVLALGGSAIANGQCAYETIVVPAPTVCPTTMSPFGINNHGHACGRFSPCAGNERPFFWSPETGVVEITFPFPYQNARAVAINDNDEVAGWVSVELTEARFFRWKDGVTTVLDPFPPFPPPHTSTPFWGWPRDIDENGLIIGDYGNPNVGPLPVPLFWASDGTTATPDSLFALPSPECYAINEHGQVTGSTQDRGNESYRAFVATTSMAVVLPPAPKAFNSLGRSINNHGKVAGSGSFLLPNGSVSKRAFLWDGSEMIDLGSGLPQSHTPPTAVALSINDLDQIVGTQAASFGWLWQNGTMVLLQDLEGVAPVSFVKGNVRINNRGEIVAQENAGPTNDMVILKPIRTRPGDVTIDCKVDVTDITMLFMLWGNTYSYDNGPGDLNGDHFVDGQDLAMVLGDWG